MVSLDKSSPGEQPRTGAGPEKSGEQNQDDGGFLARCVDKFFDLLEAIF